MVPSGLSSSHRPAAKSRFYATTSIHRIQPGIVWYNFPVCGFSGGRAISGECRRPLRLGAQLLHLRIFVIALSIVLTPIQEVGAQIPAGLCPPPAQFIVNGYVQMCVCPDGTPCGSGHSRGSQQEIQPNDGQSWCNAGGDQAGRLPQRSLENWWKYPRCVARHVVVSSNPQRVPREYL